MPKKPCGAPGKTAPKSTGDASNMQLKIQQKSTNDMARKNSRVTWTKEMNCHLVHCFFTASKHSTAENFRQELTRLFKEKYDDKKITEKKLLDQKRAVFKKAKNSPDANSNWLTEEEIKEIQTQVDSNCSLIIEMNIIEDTVSEMSESGLPKCDSSNTHRAGDEVVTGHEQFVPPPVERDLRLSGPRIEEIASKHLLKSFPAVGRFVKLLITDCPDVKKMRHQRRATLSEEALRQAAERAKLAMLKAKYSSVELLSTFEETEEDRVLHQKKLRKYAAPKIIKFFKQCLAVRFIIKTQNNLPSMSPLDNDWKDFSILFKKASKELQVIHHAWRCRKYRQSISNEKKKVLSEKLKASEIFKNKKSSYPESVATPFSGDAVNLASNSNWSKVKAKQETLIQLNFVENVTKINRADGKEVEKLLILSDQHLVLLHPASCNILYQIDLVDVQKVSCTPHKDGLLVFHLNSQDKTNKALQKGDFVVNCPRIIELVAKLALQYKTLNNRELDVAVSDKFAATFKGKSMEFVVTNQNNSEKPICRRKGNTINVGC